MLQHQTSFRRVTERYNDYGDGRVKPGRDDIVGLSPAMDV